MLPSQTAPDGAYGVPPLPPTESFAPRSATDTGDSLCLYVATLLSILLGAFVAVMLCWVIGHESMQAYQCSGCALWYGCSLFVTAYILQQTRHPRIARRTKQRWSALVASVAAALCALEVWAGRDYTPQLASLGSSIVFSVINYAALPLCFLATTNPPHVAWSADKRRRRSLAIGLIAYTIAALSSLVQVLAHVGVTSIEYLKQEYVAALIVPTLLLVCFERGEVVRFFYRYLGACRRRTPRSSGRSGGT